MVGSNIKNNLKEINMNANNAEVSSEALSVLQSDLTSLSKSLKEIYDLMHADMTQVAEFWRDPKYQEFQETYAKQIKNCDDISVRYSDWCTRILSPAIERVQAIESADVTGNGGGSVSANSGSAATSGNTTAAPNATKGKKDLFNTKKVSKKTTDCTTVDGSFLGNGVSTTTCVTDRPDGSRTTEITSCKTSGLAGSVGIAKAGFKRTKCETTTIDEKIRNSKN